MPLTFLTSPLPVQWNNFWCRNLLHFFRLLHSIDPKNVLLLVNSLVFELWGYSLPLWSLSLHGSAMPAGTLNRNWYNSSRALWEWMTVNSCDRLVIRSSRSDTELQSKAYRIEVENSGYVYHSIYIESWAWGQFQIEYQVFYFMTEFRRNRARNGRCQLNSPDSSYPFRSYT